MTSRFEELDWQQTPYGAISLRRRFDPFLQADVYEAKLDDEFLMSSAFTHGETELTRLALDLATSDKPLDVVVGGLGLGYTTHAVLADPRVRQVITVEAHAPVISWHQRRLIPDTTEVTRDRRSRLVHGDFFALTDDPDGFDSDCPGRRLDVILLDIDHSPRHLLHPSHARMYTLEGLRRLAAHLRPSGLFGLWSNDPPDQRFQQILSGVFAICHTHVVGFDNPLQNRRATNTVYLATTPATH